MTHETYQKELSYLIADRLADRFYNSQSQLIWATVQKNVYGALTEANVRPPMSPEPTLPDWLRVLTVFAVIALGVLAFLMCGGVN